MRKPAPGRGTTLAIARAIALAVALASSLALLPGCASTPAPRFYRLEPVAVPGDQVSARTVVIGPFTVADYLDRPQIVSRGAGGAVVLADFERWAEPLDSGFQSAVATNVTRLLGSDRVLEFPAQAILRPERRVTGRVSRLDVDDAGAAVLEVQWGVIGADGAVADAGRRSRYEAQAAGGGYPARVAALSSVVAAFSADVAAAVR